MAEQFAFQQMFRQGRAVHGHKGTARAFAHGVQIAREHFLARARLAGDQHRGLGSRHLPGQLQDPGNGRMPPHDARAALAFGILRPMSAKGAGSRHGRGFARLAGHGHDPFHIQRFQPVVARAQTEQAFGFFRAALVGGDDDRREIGVFRAHGQQILHPEAGKGRPRENHAGTGLADKDRSPFEIFGNAQLIAGIPQRRENAGNGLGRREKKQTTGRHGPFCTVSRATMQQHGLNTA